jgi:pSer/pThr/pTyr-binding forkhead associated (FHA) protein
MPRNEESSRDKKLRDTAVEADSNGAPTREHRIADFVETCIAVPLEQTSQGLLIVEQTPDSALLGKTLLIDRTPFDIGREDCDLMFTGAPGISRKHARITFENGAYFLTDTGSTNHTYMDEVELAIDSPRMLGGGSFIRLGKYTILRFELEPGLRRLSG